MRTGCTESRSHSFQGPTPAGSKYHTLKVPDFILPDLAATRRWRAGAAHYSLSRKKLLLEEEDRRRKFCSKRINACCPYSVDVLFLHRSSVLPPPPSSVVIKLMGKKLGSASSVLGYPHCGLLCWRIGTQAGSTAHVINFRVCKRVRDVKKYWPRHRQRPPPKSRPRERAANCLPDH